MEFAENKRISHRQLYRQMILTFSAPFLLCMYKWGKRCVFSELLSVAAALILLLFYIVFLIRVSPCFENIQKLEGPVKGSIIGVFFLIYVIFTGAFLLSVLEEIIPEILLTGVSERWISFLTLVLCCEGIHKGMQKRGRMAEVSGGVFMAGVLLMIIICMTQGKLDYLKEIMTDRAFHLSEFIYSGYDMVRAFSALGLLPFLLEDVEKQGSAGRTVMLAVLSLGGILMAMGMLLPSVLGMGRLSAEKYPVLPLLAGADLPGDILARFDVLWMGILLYGMFFAIGGLLHYSYTITEKTGLKKAYILVPFLMFFLSFLNYKNVKMVDFYKGYLEYFYVPVLLIIQTVLFWKGRIKWRKRCVILASVISFSLFLGGCCGAVEPEKRMYPMALGVDREGETYIFSYGMADTAKATGQDKGGSGDEDHIVILKGKTFEEIEAQYNRSQSKFLDLGHLETLIFGECMIQGDGWKELADYLEKKAFVGEDMYVFKAKKAEDILKWKGNGSASVGEYLIGMIENRVKKQKNKGITLRELFYERYTNGTLKKLPEIHINGKNLELL